MPGIVGIIERERNEGTPWVFQAMVNGMNRESFYFSGTYTDDQLGLRLGWTGHRDSFSDCLPIWNEKKDICLILSGEDARDGAEISSLKARGHSFNPDKAEYLIHDYEEEGERFLRKINGAFSGVLADYRRRQILLFNDRFGLSRIYYYENERGFYFSSEAKSLLKAIPGLRRFDEAGLGEHFACGCTLDNKTLFAGVALVPGGSLWKMSPGGRIERESYVRGDSRENPSVLNERQYYEKLKEIWSRLLPRYFRGGERTGVSLTGGIDSRMIMAWAPCPPFRVPCYSFGGMYRESADVKIARRVARICQQRHITIALTRKFLSEFPALAKKTVINTDGTLDVSGAVELSVNRQARDIAPIRITGNYGDQVLRRVIGFKPLGLCQEIFDGEFRDRIRESEALHDEISRTPDLSFLRSRQIPWHHYPRQALENTQLTTRAPFLDNDLLDLAFQAPPGRAANIGLFLRLIAEGLPALGRLPTDRGRTYRCFPLTAVVRQLAGELSYRAEYAFDYGMPRWLAWLDRRMRPFHLEKAFLGRQKFYHFRVWYRDALSGYVKDILLDPLTLGRSYLIGQRVESIVRDHTEGRRNYTSEIHSLLTSELIQRHLLRPSEP